MPSPDVTLASAGAQKKVAVFGGLFRCPVKIFVVSVAVLGILKFC